MALLTLLLSMTRGKLTFRSLVERSSNVFTSEKRTFACLRSSQALVRINSGEIMVRNISLKRSKNDDQKLYTIEILGCTAVHTHNAIVARHAHRILSVPQDSGTDVQPTVSTMLINLRLEKQGNALSFSTGLLLNAGLLRILLRGGGLIGLPLRMWSGCQSIWLGDVTQYCEIRLDACTCVILYMEDS
jgi:hypothetical protein